VVPTVTCPKESVLGLTPSFASADAGPAEAASTNDNEKTRPTIDRANNLRRISKFLPKLRPTSGPFANSCVYLARPSRNRPKCQNWSDPSPRDANLSSAMCCYAIKRAKKRPDAATPLLGRGAALPVSSVSCRQPDYGSTTEAGALVGVKPAAGAGPTAQVLADWLYSSE